MCPKYTNAGTSVVEVQGIRIEPGETVTTPTYIAVLPTGVTKVDDTGFFNPIIASASITSTTTVTVPATVTGNYDIEIFCSAGSVSVKYNSASGTNQVLNVGDRIKIGCVSRIIDTIIITISSGTCTYTIRRA